MTPIWAVTRAVGLVIATVPITGLGASPNDERGSNTAESRKSQKPKSAIVVRPTAWRGALEKWKSYRASQGHQIKELDAELGPEGLHSAIVQICKTAESREGESQVGYVVLVGDGDRGPSVVSPVPAWYRKSTALVQFGGDREMATDNPYADIDADERPDLAIGRIPADNAEQVERYLDRTIEYETSRGFGSWRRDLRVVAGVGGFGPVADAAIEMTTRRFLNDRVPQWANVSMTYASPNSPYCPDPWRFCESTVQQMNAGCMFWVYVGHGHVKHLDYLKVNQEYLSILNDDDVRQVKTGARPPIAIFLACYTGAFDAIEDCLSEQLVMSAGGPVAAIAATRVAGPFGLASLSSGLLENCYQRRVATLGEIVLLAKRQMLSQANVDGSERPEIGTPAEQNKPPSSPQDAQMQLLSAMATALSPQGYDLRAELQEHVWQMNLLGDPMLRLHLPATAQMEVSDKIAPGEIIYAKGSSTHAGRVTIELTRPRDRTPRDLFIAGKFTSDEVTRKKMQATYEAANQVTLQSQSLSLADAGPFACEFQTAPNMPTGRYLIKVMIEGEKTWSANSVEVLVRTARR